MVCEAQMDTGLVITLISNGDIALSFVSSDSDAVQYCIA